MLVGYLVPMVIARNSTRHIPNAKVARLEEKSRRQPTVPQVSGVDHSASQYNYHSLLMACGSRTNSAMRASTALMDRSFG
ncbi:hypothetical protein R1flu_009983 [Riccia fluitans]|uniref:Uncharacterized protein n=1 Tax=Riccia fluitans TaxID=41844 RepID=A0ABD1Z3Q0_9MARC